MFLKTVIISIFKQIRSRFQTGYQRSDIAITLARLLVYFIRGCFSRLFFKSAKGIVLVGKQVSIRYAKHLSVGSDFIIEDGAELNCLSTQGMQFGNRVTIGKNAIIRPSNIYGSEIGEGLKIGDNSNIGPFAYIGCSGFIEIGNNVMISPRVSIYAENHVFNNTELLIKDQGVSKKMVKIEDDCWIASNSVILAGVTIGKGSVIAAGAVITKDVPPFSIMAGVPAIIISHRN